MAEENRLTDGPRAIAEPPLAYATATESPWPVLARFVALFGFALSAATIVRMAVDAAGAFGIIDAPSLLAGQARTAAWSVWVLFFLLVTTLLHVVLLVGSVLAMWVRPEALKYLHTYAVAGATFVAISVAVNWGYFLWAAERPDTRAYLLTIFLVNGINNAAFPVVVLVLLRCKGFVAVFEGTGAPAAVNSRTA